MAPSFDVDIGKPRPVKRAPDEQPFEQPSGESSALPLLPRRRASQGKRGSHPGDGPMAPQTAIQPPAKRRRVDSVTPEEAHRAGGVETDAMAKARLRAPTPEPVRQAYLAGLAPNEVNLYSEEIEIGAYRVAPKLPRKTVLASRPHDGFVVELDVTFHDENSYFELIPCPKRNLEDVLHTSQAMVAFLEKIRAYAHEHGTFKIPIRELIPDIADEYADRYVMVDSLLPVANFQTTFGVTLQGFEDLLEFHPGRYDVEHLRARAAEVEARLEAECGEPVPPNLAAFIKIVLYYLDEASSTEEIKNTVHDRFTFMLRADFHSMYKLLLDENERSMARVLCTPFRDGEDPVFAQALGMKGDTLMFARPYAVRGDDGQITHNEGPTLGHFIESIVKGPRDAVSPPPGGGPTNAMGREGSRAIDRVNKTVRVEARDQPARQDVAINGLMVQQSQGEFNFARRFNRPVLGAHDDKINDGEDEQSWSATISAAMHEVGCLYVDLRVGLATLTFPEVVADLRARPRQHIADLEAFMDDESGDGFAPLQQAVGDLHRALDAKGASLRELEEAFCHLIDVMRRESDAGLDLSTGPSARAPRQ